MKRPLFVIGIVFGGCLLAARLAGFHAALIAASVSALLFILALALRKTRGNTAIIAALLSAVAAFSVFTAREHLIVRPLQALDGETVHATVWLTEQAASTDRSVAYYARVTAGELPPDTRLLLWVSNHEDAPELYNQATAALHLSATDEWREKGIYVKAWADGEWAVDRTDRRPWDAGFAAWRSAVLSRVNEKADGEVAGVIRAVCFGDKSGLSRETIAAFSDAGLSHLAAVSGFHMSVITMGFFGLLCLLSIKRRVAAMVTLPLPLVFAALTGFSYSTLRACVMCALVLLANVWRLQSDTKNSLGGAVLLLLLVDPNAIWDLGFLLSVTATLGIVCVAPWINPKGEETLWRRRVAKALWASVWMSVTATLATLPILALTFGRLPMLSPLANLLAQPAASVIVVCGCTGTVLQSVPWLSALASPLFFAAGLAARFLLWWARWIASLPFAVLALRHTYLLVWACLLPVAMVLGWRLLRGHGLRVATIMLTIAVCAAALAHTLGMRGVTVLTATNLSDGTALLLTRDGHHGLVLTGDSHEATYLLRQQGIDRLDFVLYTKEDEMTADIPAASVFAPTDADGVTRLDDTATVTFWNDSTARLCNGWLMLTIGETRVLLCPPNGDAATLPDAMRWSELVIFDRTPPRHVTALSASGGVLCADAEALPAVTKAVPWGSYPILTTADEAVTIKTRGQGDWQN